ncbi:P-selectin-like isoform X1 [Mauremys mutica]|uniref:P-selectin-like isoform X1 n=1 Tax=Mauremys mutica TaxID=74926 RepID=UPI001D16549A|nr:P-selectin-like isoform X1 [Mauremys mutica]
MGSTVGLCSSPRAWGCGWNVTRLLCFAAVSWVLVTQMEVGAWTYHYGNKSDYSWELARNFCRSFYTDLVAIQNQGEIAYLNSVLPHYKTYYWIGIRKIKNVWTWIGTNKVLTKEAENWANREPNNKGRNQDCVEIYIKRDRDAGKWNDEHCQKKKKALCYQASCQRSSCSQRGECVETIGNYTCDCYPGFYGPECEQAVKCPALATPGRGRLNCTHWHGDFTYNSTCTFSCETGFVRNGSETLECTALGQWTGHPPLCEAVKCPVPDSLGRGRLNCSHWHGDFTYNSTCAFSCETGFVRNGSETLECTALGQWTGHPPHCEAVKCPVLAASDRGRLNCTHWHGDFTYNSTCAFSCEMGFVLNGLEMLECTALGQWTGHPPRCEAVKCPVLDSPGRGQLNCTNWHGDFTYNSTCTFSCEMGFVQNGSETLQCMAQGQWTGHPPRCEAVKCPVLDSPDRGQLNCTHWHGDFTYNSTCAFSCVMGFVLNGSEKLECTALGQWTGQTPHCEAVTCPGLAAPGRGRLNCTHWHGDFTYNSTCAFSCETGFVLNGSETLECTALGQWTGHPPRCEAVKCPELDSPGRGRLNCTHWHGDFTYNSTCTFSCETGFVLNGSETLECMALGQWRGQTPRCEAVKCPVLDSPDRGQLNCTHWHGDFTYNSTCAFSCVMGFVLNGSEKLECTALGQWRGQTPRCEAVTCPGLAAPGRNRLNCTHWHGDFTYNSTCAFSCETGFVLNGSETLECTALGQWTGHPPRCEAVKCPVLDSPGRGRLNCTHWHGDFTYNSTCTFSCETGFVLNGSETLECMALEQWRGQTPRCEVMRCPKLRGLEPILMNCSHPLGSFSYGSVCRFRCTQGYFLNGTSRVQCQPDGYWSDKMPACQGEAAPYFKQVLLYMGGGAVALVALLLTGMFIALLIKRLSDKEEEKMLLNPTSNLGAPGVFTNAAFDSNL